MLTEKIPADEIRAGDIFHHQGERYECSYSSRMSRSVLYYDDGQVHSLGFHHRAKVLVEVDSEGNRLISPKYLDAIERNKQRKLKAERLKSEIETELQFLALVFGMDNLGEVELHPMWFQTNMGLQYQINLVRPDAEDFTKYEVAFEANLVNLGTELETIMIRRGGTALRISKDGMFCAELLSGAWKYLKLL